MKTNSKRKGGAFERKIAKELSIWMFEDEDVLKRHPTSGTDKCIWTGDVVPLKQLPEYWNKWCFQIECKTGYKTFYPDFWNYNKILDWIDKAEKEAICHNQNILFLICQFKYRKALLITNFKFIKIKENIIFNHNEIFYYVYEYQKIIESNFNDSFSFIQKEKEVLIRSCNE